MSPLTTSCLLARFAQAVAVQDDPAALAARPARAGAAQANHRCGGALMSAYPSPMLDWRLVLLSFGVFELTVVWCHAGSRLPSHRAPYWTARRVLPCLLGRARSPRVCVAISVSRRASAGAACHPRCAAVLSCPARSCAMTVTCCVALPGGVLIVVASADEGEAGKKKSKKPPTAEEKVARAMLVHSVSNRTADLAADWSPCVISR